MTKKTPGDKIHVIMYDENSAQVLPVSATQKLTWSILPLEVKKDVYEAVTSGSGAIAQGPGTAVVEPEGVTIGPSEDTGEPVVMPVEAAYDRVHASSTAGIRDSGRTLAEARQNAVKWDRWMQVAGAVALILLCVTVWAGTARQLPAAAVSAIATAIVLVGTKIFRDESNLAKTNSRASAKELAGWHQLGVALGIADTIGGSEARDALKVEIVRRMIGREKDSSGSDKPIE